MKTQFLTKSGYTITLLASIVLIYPAHAVYKDNVFILQLQKKKIQLKGTVKDSKGVLIGAVIQIKGSSIATTTNTDGNYSLEVFSGNTIVVSYIGYSDKEITIANETTVNITLVQSDDMLEEVVVNAGYYTVKDRERTGSIAKINSQEISQVPVKNFVGTLQGKIPGVQVSQNSGVPGSGYSIKIRGTNSIRSNANTPLYIIDGIPISTDNMSTSLISSGAIPLNNLTPLANINPNNIESIEILKDADATAIYGSRGANGVVLITTKRNKLNGTHFSINSSTGIGKTVNTIKLMNTEQYLKMREQAFKNDNINIYPTNAYDINGVWDKKKYTNWQKELLGETAVFNNIYLQISGGNTNTKFLVNVSSKQETSVFKANTLYKQLGIFSSLNHNSNDDRFKINLTTSYSINQNNLPSIDLTKKAYTLSPNAPNLFNQDGSLNWENGTWENPLARTQSIYKNKTKNLNIGSDITYLVTTNITAKLNLGYTNYESHEINTTPSTIYNPSLGRTSANSSLALNQGNTNTLIVEPQLSWFKTIKKHTFQFLIGSTFQQQNTEILNLSASNFISNSLIESISAANTIKVNSQLLNQYKYQSLFTRINYSLLNKLFINITGRRDGSSRFGTNNRFGNFGAIGGAWVFTENNSFNNNSSLITFGKLRSSYGITGSDQIGDYQYLDLYAINSSNSGSYDGSVGMQPSRLLNQNFSWEVNKKFEIALDLNLLSNKIALSLAWYKNNSSNQLVGMPLAATTGFNTIQANLDAQIQNTGLEFNLNTKNIETKNFNWSSQFNISFEKNKLLKFPNLESSSYAQQYRVGKSIHIQRMYHYLGVDNQGVYQFKDYDKNGKISYFEDRESIIDLTPKYYGGFHNSLEYKNWSLSMLFIFSRQKSILYNLSTALPGTMVNQPKELINNHDQSSNNPFQKYTTGKNPELLSAYLDYFTQSDYLVKNSSFIKLKTLELSYKFSPILSNTLSGKIYLQGYNLLTITPFKGIDPEAASFNHLPPIKTYTIGVELNF